MTDHNTPDYSRAAKLRPVGVVRGTLLRERMVRHNLADLVKALSGDAETARLVQRWAGNPKAALDIAIAALHAGRIIEAELGFHENATACVDAVLLLERLAAKYGNGVVG